MGIGKRLLDLAKSNLNALLDRARENATDALSDDELEAELERRKLRRLQEDEERRKRIAAERAAAERAQARAAEAAAARNTGAAGGVRGASAGAAKGARPNAGAKSGGARARSLPTSEKKLSELYALLEVRFGAPFDEVKASFRRLMRQHHPDLHAGDPAAQMRATQRTMELTEAYRELERRLDRR